MSKLYDTITNMVQEHKQTATFNMQPHECMQQQGELCVTCLP